MEYLIIPLISLGASLLTFFSGFGLGTLLTPAFALFFTVELSVGLTAIVHFLNNFFKLWLVGKYANKEVLIRFGIPAIVASFIGATLLTFVSDLPTLFSYQFLGQNFEVIPANLTIALLLIFFTLFEIIPRLKNLEIDKRYLPLGGILSGFFGGLSGHQGALRSAFLARSGLSKEEFVGTRTVIACMIDVTRIIVYLKHLTVGGIADNSGLLLVTTLAAFGGAYFGNKLLKSITMKSIQKIVSLSLFLLAIALGLGWV